MKRILLNATLATLALTVLLGMLYPLAMTGVSQVVFHGNANGQIIRHDGQVIGSKIIGQRFTDTHGRPDLRYFQSRPSATTPPDNAAATAFANLGPNDRATARAISANVRSYLALEQPYDRGLTEAGIPVDAVDTSASGIDPDISPANAGIQAHRVAAVRHLPMGTVMRLVDRFSHGRGLGFSGEPGVNVLQLNLALNRVSSGGH